MSTTRRSVAEDLQETRPTALISLSRAGVTRSAKAIRISHNGAERLFQAEIEGFFALRTPVSDIPTQEMYGRSGIAAGSPTTGRRLVGVTAQGMNACPCAQRLI